MTRFEQFQQRRSIGAMIGYSLAVLFYTMGAMFYNSPVRGTASDKGLIWTAVALYVLAGLSCAIGIWLTYVYQKAKRRHARAMAKRLAPVIPARALRFNQRTSEPDPNWVLDTHQG